MPSWVMVTDSAAGIAFAASTTYYLAPTGKMTNTIDGLFPEADCQVRGRDAYTLSKLFVRVVANTTTNTSTVRSRKNGANGNQVVSIGAGATGTFTDAGNTDGLVSGDTFNTRITVAVGGSLTLSIISYVLSAAANNTPILASFGARWQEAGYSGYMVTIQSVFEYWDEARCSYTFRTASTLSNLRVRIFYNDANGASTFRVRKNGANGNLVVSVPSGTTGAFEDTDNTDAVAVGNTVDYSLAIGGGSGGVTWTLLQLKSSSIVKQTGSAVTVGTFVTSNLTRYYTIEGEAGSYHATESRSQCTTRIAFTGRNMFMRVITNTLNGATTIRIRKSGANGNMNVSIPAGTTGTYEDLVRTDDFVVADTLNWQIVTEGNSGNIEPIITGFELVQPAAPPPAGMPYNIGRVVATMR